MKKPKQNTRIFRMRVLHLDTNHPLLMEELQTLGCVNEEDYDSDYNAVLQKISQYDGLIIRSRIPVDKNLLENAPNLKFIGRVGAGMENIDVDFARERGIELISAPEGNRNAVAEHALGMLLGLMHKIYQGNEQVKSGVWDREGNRGVELNGKTVGIIGYGNTGKAFAKKLSGFSTEVLCTDIIDGLGDDFAKQVSLNELQQRCHVISLHVPLTPLTQGMVNTEFIAAFNRPFWLLNTSRGACVDTDSLVDALKKRKILGAGLDVLEYEKTSFETIKQDANNSTLQYLIDSKNVILTPHVAGWSVESKAKLAQVVVDKITEQFFSKLD